MRTDEMARRIRAILEEVDAERRQRHRGWIAPPHRVEASAPHPCPSCGSSSHECLTDALRVIGARRCDGCGRVFTP